MAGAIQLESRGLLDAYTTDRPDFTFWKEGFHKKSQFSIQTVDIASSKDFEYGEIHTFKILPDQRTQFEMDSAGHSVGGFKPGG